MTREIAEVVAGVDRAKPVVSLEEDQVWVSGMNSRPWVLARSVERRLRDAGYDVGEPTDDEAAQHGGILVPVDGCEPISDATFREVFGDGT